MKRSIISTLCILFVVTMAYASVLEQQINLKEGWNAVYLEVTPKNAKPNDVFKNIPSVKRVGCYYSDAYERTVQYTTDGERIKGMPLAFASWDRDISDAATLHNIVGGMVYLVYSEAACSITLSGRPVLPYMMWRDTSKADAMMNLVGVSVDAGVEVTAKNYFSNGPYSATGSAYEVGGKDSAVPAFFKLGNRAKLTNGSAIAATGTKDGEWSGDFKVMVSSTSYAGIRFDGTKTLGSLVIENITDAPLKIRVTHRASDDVSQVAPKLKYLNRDTTFIKTGVWEDFSEGKCFEKTLAAHEKWDFSTTVDMLSLDGVRNYGSLLRIEAIDSASRMRVFVPIDYDAEQLVAKKNAFPKGLWVGKMDFQLVDKLGEQGAGTSSSLNPEKAGGMVRANLILFVDESNRVSLLQRVCVGASTNEQGVTSLRLFQDIEKAPSDMFVQRISSALMDIENPKIISKDTIGSEACEFGKRLGFSFTIDEHSKVNPFRHPWHPEHDGLDATFKDYVASGDNFENYKQPVKPELFSITNNITLSWYDVNGDSTFDYNVEEITYGRVDWIIKGLRANENPGGDIIVSGVFMLKRVTDTSVLE